MTALCRWQEQTEKSIFWAMLPQIRFMAVRVPVAAATLQTGQIL